MNKIIHISQKYSNLKMELYVHKETLFFIFGFFGSVCDQKSREPFRSPRLFVLRVLGLFFLCCVESFFCCSKKVRCCSLLFSLGRNERIDGLFCFCVSFLFGFSWMSKSLSRWFFFSLLSTTSCSSSPPLTSSPILQLWNYSTMPPLVIVGLTTMAGFTFFLLLLSFIFLLIYFFSFKMSGSPCNDTWDRVTCHTSDVIALSLVILCFLISNPSPKITPSNEKKSFSFHSPHLIFFSRASMASMVPFPQSLVVVQTSLTCILFFFLVKEVKFLLTSSPTYQRIWVEHISRRNSI